ncbi:MAG TPA: AraC family transcriptional regulator [Steroidobacteraceae bacterium]
MSTLDGRFVALSECLVAKGHRLEMGAAAVPGIHYNLTGDGTMYVGDNPPIVLAPHTLIVVPPNVPFRIEVAVADSESPTLKTVDGRVHTISTEGIKRFIAGEGAPDLIMICGFFTASYGHAADLFCTLTTPIVEQFDASDELDQKFRRALSELVVQEVGAGAMSAALLKQVLVTLLRRSLVTLNTWVERFSIISDPQIARAFAEMASNPGAAHTIRSLAQCACLSRSAFMARFAAVMGRPPMIVLRELRMRQAAKHLKVNTLSIGQVARNVGYASRSSFVRAFRGVYGRDPSAYRDHVKQARVA